MTCAAIAISHLAVPYQLASAVPVIIAGGDPEITQHLKLRLCTRVTVML